MSQSQELFNIRQKHLVGKFFFTDRGAAAIESIDIPEAHDIFIVSEEDLKKPFIDMFGIEVPVFAHGFSDYAGQPLFAVFGHTWESVDSFISKVEVHYSENNGKENETEVVLEKKWSSGKMVDLDSEDLANIVVKSKFVVNRHSSSLLGDQRIIASYSDDNLSIKLASQWPLHVRDCIAVSLGLPRKAIEIVPVHFRAAFDELMLGPEIAGVVTSAAAVKFNGLVEFSMPMTSHQAKLEYAISTLMSESGAPLMQKALVTVDLGAYPVLASEYVNSIIAGVNPPYGLDASETQVTVLKSYNSPTVVFGDLGYAMSVAATENHYSSFVAKLGEKQTEWRKEHIGMTSMKKSLYSSSQFDSIAKTLDNCATASWFDRQYAVYSQKTFSSNHINPFISYARGVGIACGQGIQGFSNKFSYLKHYSISGHYLKEKKVKLSCGMLNNANYTDLWTDTLASELGIEPEDVVFNNINHNEVQDVGPDTLSRGVRTIPHMLQNFSEQVKEKLSSKEIDFPIRVSVSIDPSSKKELYNSDSYGTIVIALHIDPILLIPVIDNIWGRFNFGRITDKPQLSNNLRQMISRTVAEFCPSTFDTYAIDIDITSNPEKPIASGDALVRGLTTASLVSALSQALGHTVHTLPINEQDISLIIANQRKNKKEAESEVQL